jgi:hypothetical protein
MLEFWNIGIDGLGSVKSAQSADGIEEFGDLGILVSIPFWVKPFLPLFHRALLGDIF